ncbi:MAG: response regulator [Cellvibrionaceae bacterium]
MKVLLAESDTQQRDIIETLCQKLQYDYLTVSSVDDAILASNAQNFDLIYTAHYLDDATGFDLCRQVRKNQKALTTPIVLITRDSHQSFVEKAFSAGISETFGQNQLEQLEIYFSRIGEHYQPINGRVLVVEDSPIQQKVIITVLEDVGLSVDGCDSVDSAWALFSEHNYDLIITDIVLEGAASGLHLVNRVRRLSDASGETPIIVMSAYDDEKRRVELFRLGADEYISKPIIHDELIARSRRLIRSAQLTKEVQNNHTAMSQFLGRMSHECRNSINVIKGISRLMLRKGPLNERQEQQLGMIETAAEHQLALVNDILDYSKLQAHELQLHTSRCELKNLLQEIIDLFHFKAEESQIDLNLAIDHSLPKHVDLDELKVKQILLNLVGNALKFTENGKITLAASCSDQGHLQLQVIDTGPGIDPKDIDLLFKAFKQTQLGAAQKGTGLGLTICSELAHLMGGKMSVSSELRKGSCFQLSMALDIDKRSTA